MTAPWVLLPLMALAAGIGWWFRGSLNKSQIDGLKSQNKALEAHRKLAEDQALDRGKQLDQAKAEIGTLRSQIQAGTTPQETLLATANSTASTIDYLRGANSEIVKLFTVRPGKEQAKIAEMAKLLAGEYTPQITKKSE